MRSTNSRLVFAPLLTLPVSNKLILVLWETRETIWQRSILNQVLFDGQLRGSAFFLLIVLKEIALKSFDMQCSNLE